MFTLLKLKHFNSENVKIKNVFTLLNLKHFNSENVKIKNVFTLGLMAQATLVEVKGTKHEHRLAKTVCRLLFMVRIILLFGPGEHSHVSQ